MKETERDFVQLSQHFTDWCGKEGIKRVLLDLDDTYCSTSEVFREILSQVYVYLETNAPFLSRNEWKNQVQTTNNRLFEQMGVRKTRWNDVVDELAEKHALDRGVTCETKRIFQLIYTTPIQPKDGAEEGLSFLKETGVPLGIVTHANEYWTWMKYDWLRLDRFVKKDDFFIVDENGHKTVESWKQAIEHFGLTPSQCVVVGDSPRSDINPAWELGVRHCFLVEDDKQWSVHQQPVHDEVKVIKHLNQIAEAVLYP